MQVRLVRQMALFTCLLLIVGICFTYGSAQQRRKKSRHSSSQAPAPTATPQSPPTADAPEGRIISTVDESVATANNDSPQKPGAKKKRPGGAAPIESDQESMRRTIVALTDQVSKLSVTLTQMQAEQRTLVDMERLTRADQRAESLRAQLLDVRAKEADLQGRADQIDYALKPENIDRAVGMIGTLHPEDARAERRRQLENLKNGIQSQLGQLAESRVRLQSAIVTSDEEVEMLHRRLDVLNQPPANASSDSATPVTSPPDQPPSPKSPEVPPR